MKCFYHSADLDGHCSGAIIKGKYPECEMIGVDYGKDFPWYSIEADEKVFMVDFSLQPFEEMATLVKVCPDLVWIDHHKSAIEEYKEWLNAGNAPILGIQRIGIGACALVWEYLCPETNLPTFIKLLGEYDVWNHSDPRTLSFQYGMRQFADTNPSNQEFWLSLFDVEEVQRITEIGGVILAYIKTENGKYCDACSFKTELDGLKCIAVNKMLANSQLFDSVWNEKKYDAMLTFGFRNGKWTISLYSTKDNVDVSAIAKSHGGGGHKGAAGFQCEKLPFYLTVPMENNKWKTP